MISLAKIKLWLKYKPSKNIDSQTLELVLAYLGANVEYAQIKEILVLPSDTLEEFTKSVYHRHLNVYHQLAKTFSFHFILRYYFEYQQFKKNLQKQIVGYLSYPLLLLLCVYGLMSFFLIKIFPMLFALLASFNLNIRALNIIHHGLWIVFIIFTTAFFLLIVFFLIFLKRQNQKIFVILFHHHRWFNLFKMTYTQMFAYMFRLIMNFGASTNQIIQIMRQSTLSYFVGWLAQLTNYELEEGKTLVKSIENDLLDKQFVRFIQVSAVDNQINQYLKTYLELNEKRIFLSIRKLADATKQITYVLLALLMLLLYQVLLAPMQMMNNL